MQSPPMEVPTAVKTEICTFKTYSKSAIISNMPWSSLSSQFLTSHQTTPHQGLVQWTVKVSFRFQVLSIFILIKSKIILH